jgi:hypothetical protein
MSTMSTSTRAQSNFQSLPKGNQNGSPVPPRLLSSPSSASEKKGLLEASILSVYDLPFSEPPVAVTLHASGMTVSTGPPVARHTDRNSFRFSSASNNSNSPSAATNNNSGKYDLKLVASLRDLYKSKVTIRVIYSNKSQNLETEYELRQLRVHESKWLILNLNQGDAQALATITDDDEISPTIRLKLQLSGPYRAEIGALVGSCQAWFGVVDSMETNALQAWKTIPKLPVGSSKFLLLPAVPIVATLVVASPLVAGVVMVGLPFLLPLVLMLVSMTAGLIVTGGVVYSSTKHGREHVGGTMAPFVESLLSSRSGQTLMYDTGPRPTPVSVANQVLPKEMWAKLVVSLLIDLIGSSSYLLPVVGEGLDLAWAPTQTILIMAMYDSTSPNLKYVSVAEELMPFTDIVPSATIGWAFEFAPQLLGNNPNIAQTMNNFSSERAVAATTNPVSNPYR